MDHVSTDAISIADRSATLSVPATVRVDAPGVRIREGQVVTVTVRIRPVEAAPAPTPTPAGKRRR